MPATECPDMKRLRIIAEDLDRCDPGNADAATMFRARIYWEMAEADARRIDWLADTHGDTLAGLLRDHGDSFRLRDHIDMAAGTWPDPPDDGPREVGT